MIKWKLISIILIGIVVVQSVILFNQYRHINLVNEQFLGNKQIVVVAVSSPIYRSTPLVGNYPFVINSGILVRNLTHYVLFIAYVNINLTKVKVGDSFLIYPSINIGSYAPEQLYNDPLLNVTILNNTVFTMNGLEYLTFTIKVNIVALNTTASGGATILLNSSIHDVKIGAPKGSTAVAEIFNNTSLFIGLQLYNNSEIKLEFYIAPNTISFKL
jgi:hypothetical protein